MDANQKILQQILKEQKGFRKILKDQDVKFDKRFKKQDAKFDFNLKRELEKQGKEFQLHISFLMENIDARFKAINEQYEDIRKTLDSHTEMLGEMKEDIEIMKSELRIMRRELNGKAEFKDVIILEKRVCVLEEKVNSL
ncbi:MAG: hypothetical protein V1655_03600 [bacterium]